MSVAKYLTDIANYIRMRLETTEKYKLENVLDKNVGLYLDIN